MKGRVLFARVEISSHRFRVFILVCQDFILKGSNLFIWGYFSQSNFYFYFIKFFPIVEIFFSKSRLLSSVEILVFQVKIFLIGQDLFASRDLYLSSIKNETTWSYSKNWTIINNSLVFHKKKKIKNKKIEKTTIKKWSANFFVLFSWSSNLAQHLLQFPPVRYLFLENHFVVLMNSNLNFRAPQLCISVLLMVRENII